MHILLTDILTCPRCGPAFGLILLVEEAADRQVERGWLACSNCRERYPIEGGVADFREGQAGAEEGELAASEVARLVALAGVTSGPGYLLVAGPAAAHAAAIAEAVPDVPVIAVAGQTPAALERAGVARAPERPGAEAASRLAVAERLPFRSEVMAGVILTGRAADVLLEEGARALLLVGRLVLQPIPAEAHARLSEAGLSVLAEDGATLVAVRR